MLLALSKLVILQKQAKKMNVEVYLIGRKGQKQYMDKSTMIN